MAHKRFGLPDRSRGFTLIELMIVVAIIGLLASVAIPAFFKYIWRARSIEAQLNLGKMGLAASAYFMAEHADAKGNVLARQFPDASIKHEPVPDSCWNHYGNKCDGGYNDNTPFEENPTWNALNFGVDDPHYYAYQFAPGNRPAHGATARNDLHTNERGEPLMFAGDLTGPEGQAYVAWAAAWGVHAPPELGVGQDHFDMRLFYDSASGTISHSSITSYREAGLIRGKSTSTVSFYSGDGGGSMSEAVGFSSGGAPSGDGGGSLSENVGFEGPATGTGTGGGSMDENVGFVSDAVSSGEGGGSMSENVGFVAEAAATGDGAGTTDENVGFVAEAAVSGDGAGATSENLGFVQAQSSGDNSGTIANSDLTGIMSNDSTDSNLPHAAGSN